jgi:hypothetical protein
MFSRRKADQFAPAHARERRQQRHRAVADRKRVSDREHGRQRNDGPLRRVLLARTLDPARVAANHLIIHGGLEDRMQQPVGLGPRHPTSVAVRGCRSAALECPSRSRRVDGGPSGPLRAIGYR